MFCLQTVLAAFLCLMALVHCQCPNEVAAANPNLRTGSANNTWLVVPIPKAAVQKAINQGFPQYQLLPSTRLRVLDVPASALPAKFPSGAHPVVVSAGLNDDIRMSALQIKGALVTFNAYAPWVGVGTSSTPLNAQLSSYIAGTDEALLEQFAGLVPALAATLLEGSFTRLGDSDPGSAAYQAIGGDQYFINTKWNILDNPLTGPGLKEQAFDLLFRDEPESMWELPQLKALINQPIILSGILTVKCARNTYYFGNATAEPQLRIGNVTMGPASSMSLVDHVLVKASQDGTGKYFGVGGVSACTQNVGYPLYEDCELAAKNVDPAAL